MVPGWDMCLWTRTTPIAPRGLGPGPEVLGVLSEQLDRTLVSRSNPHTFCTSESSMGFCFLCRRRCWHA